MTFWVSADPDTARLGEVATRLLGARADVLGRGATGGNNRIYRMEAGGELFALKVYPRSPDDPRDRLSVEFTALSFLSRHGVATVPQAVAADHEAGVAVYSWIEGVPPGAPQPEDIDAALTFASELRALGAEPDAAALPLASEACLSVAELISQVERRLTRLLEVAHDRVIEGRPELMVLLDRGIRPALARWRKPAESRGGGDLSRALWTLSPSDFGLHNALRRAGGSLAFVDFEYFGWDDPVKLAADFVLHPGMRLDVILKRRFLAGIIRASEADAAFLRRFEVLYPLYGLRWCLILLNEFLPERWNRRVFAGADNLSAVEARQLAKARDLLETLQEHDGRPPYDV